jgi:phosphoenolpyruvate phosphomutase
MKTAYTCFCTDVIHEGHLNIINEAKKRGRVIIGCLSDAASIRYNKFPTISQEERLKLYRSIEGVDEVVIQNDMLYDDVIKLIKPDYVLHGDNWVDGPEKAIHDHVENLVKEYGGEIEDIPYTYNEKVKKIDMQLREKLAMPEYRR